MASSAGSLSTPMQPYGSSLSHGYGASNGHRVGKAVNRNILSSPTLAFKDSPFYSIKALLGDVRICEGIFGHYTPLVRFHSDPNPLHSDGPT